MRYVFEQSASQHFNRLTLKFYRAWWLLIQLLAGDASVDSRFREIYVPRARRVYLATGFDFCEKYRTALSPRSEP